MINLEEILEKHQKWLNGEEGGRRADLCGADLNGANLSEADLRRADLSGANLSEANLWGADMWGANLNGANLWGADMWGANLRGAVLREANMNGANLSEAKIDDVTAARLMVCPSVGAFTGWKKADGYIIKLLIPEDAKRSSATTRKCRCSKAEVLGIEMLDGTESGVTELRHMAYDHETVYKVGETVYPDSWDDDRWNECSHGIHFFITREEAVAYG